MVLSSRAQGAIEYLLIIGAAIIVVAVVIVAITSVSNSGKTQLSSAGASHAIDPLKEASGNYFRISNYYYLKSDLGNGLVGLWHFDEGSGTTTIDSSGKGNTGVFGNSREPSNSAYFPVWAGGKFGTALSFNGVTNKAYVNGGGDASLILGNTIPITLHAWVNIPSGGGGAVLVKGKSGGCWEYGLVLSASSVSARFSGSDLTSSVTSVPLNQWVQVIIVYNPGVNVKYYVNGVLKDTIATTRMDRSTCTDVRLWVGSSYASTPFEFFTGSIDEVAIWNRALSASEIQSLYTNSQ
jgi:hypothetical protein